MSVFTAIFTLLEKKHFLIYRRKCIKMLDSKVVGLSANATFYNYFKEPKL